MKSNHLAILALVGALSYTEAMKLNRPSSFWDDEQLVDTERQYLRYSDANADTYYYPSTEKFWNDLDRKFLAGGPQQGAPQKNDQFSQMQKQGFPGVTFVGPRQAALDQKQQSGWSGAAQVHHRHAAVANDWDFESLRHMGVPTVYKDGSPDGYVEHVAWVDGGDNVNTKDWNKITEWDDIKAQAKELAAKSQHEKTLYPNMTAEPPAKVEKPQTIFKSNESGDVPPILNKKGDDEPASFMVLGKGAVQITNQEKLYQMMQFKKGPAKSKQDQLYHMMQTASQTYPEKDTHSYIDDVTNGFREHAWSDEQYGKGNFTDESSYLKHMPKGYSLDLEKDYAIPKSKKKGSASNSTKSANKTKKANSTDDDDSESKDKEDKKKDSEDKDDKKDEKKEKKDGEDKDEKKDKKKKDDEEKDEKKEKKDDDEKDEKKEDKKEKKSKKGEDGDIETDKKSTKKKDKKVKPLNETQIQDRLDKAMDDTYTKDESKKLKARDEKLKEKYESEGDDSESFAQVFKLAPSHLNEQHGAPNVQQEAGKPIYPSKDSHSEILPYDQREHAFNTEQYTNSSEKTWNESTPNGMPLAGTYAQRSFWAKPNIIYPAKDSHSEILPYDQREHAFNTEQYTNSSEKTWNESTPNGMPLAGTYAQRSFWAQHPIYPAKDSHSEILPYNQRDHAFNDEQYTNSSEKTWNESTPNGMPLSGTYAFWAAQPIYPAKDSHSEILPYDQREHAFNTEQYTNSSEKTWNESTPNGMPLADTYAQKAFWAKHPIYPAKDSNSEILPYNQRDHAFNNEQYTNSSEKTWNESSPNGMPLADTYGFNAIESSQQEGQGQLQFMSIQEALDKYRVETHSKIIPYVIRDHAWNFGHHDQTNFYRYRDDAPEGYKDAVKYRVPHPTNVPVPPKVIVDIKEKEEEDDHADEIEEAEKNKTKKAAEEAAGKKAAQIESKANTTQITAKSNSTSQIDSKKNTSFPQNDNKEISKPEPNIEKKETKKDEKKPEEKKEQKEKAPEKKEEKKPEDVQAKTGEPKQTEQNQEEKKPEKQVEKKTEQKPTDQKKTDSKSQLEEKPKEEKKEEPSKLATQESKKLEKPTESQKPIEVPKSAQKSIEAPKPADQPINTQKPVEAPKPVEATKPVTPASAPKLAEEPAKSVPATKPVEQPAQTTPAKPVEQPKKQEAEPAKQK